MLCLLTTNTKCTIYSNCLVTTTVDMAFRETVHMVFCGTLTLSSCRSNLYSTCCRDLLKSALNPVWACEYSDCRNDSDCVEKRRGMELRVVWMLNTEQLCWCKPFDSHFQGLGDVLWRCYINFQVHAYSLIWVDYCCLRVVDILKFKHEANDVSEMKCRTVCLL